jgi:hypothetical protein
MGSNDVVNLMQRSLARMTGLDVVAFDVQLYGPSPSQFVVREGHVNWIKEEVVDDLVAHYEPDVLICNAGGLSPTPSMHARLAIRGVRRVGLALSDPDDFPKRSCHFARLFDLFYTNAAESVCTYEQIGVQAELLPFAADPTFHRPLDVPKKCDVVVVGGRRPERLSLVMALRAAGLRVDCYGSGWHGYIWGKLGFSSEVHGEAHVAAINSGIVYLSFPSTAAGFKNVKVGVFEAAACGACIVIEDFDELHRYFRPGFEIVTYNSRDDLIEQGRTLRASPQEVLRIGQACRQRLLEEHTWEHRWTRIFKDINELRR